MPCIDHSRRTGALEDVIGRHQDGTLLQGEADMYKRIMNDCSASQLNWHVWYDLSLPIQSAGQTEIQIDFLLICEKGAIVLEVKGGGIAVLNGRYYYVTNQNYSRQMKTTPFDQARNYKWALLNNNVLNGDKLFVDYAVAFPHQEMSITNENESIDQSFWLWDKQLHDDPNYSFCTFCEEILDYTRANSAKSRFIPILTTEELDSVVQVLSPTLFDKSRYSQSTLTETLNWLHIQNLDNLESLKRNKRVLIEGGPGTGKTTMAKAFIKTHKGLKGLYLCYNRLLYAKMRESLIQENLHNCEVFTFIRYLQSLCGNINTHELNPNPDDVKKIILDSTHKLYDYIIIDEAQDIADKGIEYLIDNLISVTGDGLTTGNYLIFYDTEQGYNSNSRRIEEKLLSYLQYATHFKLNENKRVVTNREIVNQANQILSNETEADYKNFINELTKNNGNQYLRTIRAGSTRDLFGILRSAARLSEDKLNTVVLAHSAFKHMQYQGDDSIYDVLSDKPVVHILEEDEIANPPAMTIPFTTILKYKGLETNKVILIIPGQWQMQFGDFRNFLFEVYVGFTRAMMELQIIVFTRES